MDRLSCTIGFFLSMFFVINISYEKGFVKVGYVEACNIHCYGNGCLSDVKVTYYNRTTRAINFNMTFTREFDDNSFINIVFYRWINRQYIHFLPMSFKFSLKHFMSGDYFGFGYLLRTSTKPPITWPVTPKMTYVGTNWVIPTDKFPPNIPLGKYKVDIKLIPNVNDRYHSGFIELRFKYTQVYDDN